MYALVQDYVSTVSADVSADAGDGLRCTWHGSVPFGIEMLCNR